MAVRVRLTRVGSKKNAMWRVVVADQRSPRDGRFIEMIGHYNPQTQPSQIVIDRERLDHWIKQGAQPTDTVRKLMRAENTPAGATAAAVAEPAEAPAAEPEPAEPEAATEVAEAAEPDAAEPDAAQAEAESAPEAAPDAEADSDAEGKAEAEADSEKGSG